MVHIGHERRRHIRVNVSLQLSYTLISSPQQYGESITKNISGGGIRLPLKENLEVGTLLKLELDLLKEKKKIPLEARVVWVKSTADNPKYPYEGGIEFINIDSLKRNMISNYIQYLNREELLKEVSQ